MRQHKLNRNFEIIIYVLDNNKKCFPKLIYSYAAASPQLNF